ncbi:hypothetical protein L207DRAFT_285213 [Hyaloscypha variabilis F]|jgi:hypothetical protein|uniref:Uncharacterized protein n=1 Tax=Hyaloscypha variabilis (strain UAMH 11265 / GT02V1 / F) TaxID=1149755 RepID=A0A2J6S1L1_HYAVF|nr:hypothetical protein L207DRAFT_285213 [Hyaloscypha variabilis F]
MPVFNSSLGDTRHFLLNAGNLKCWAFGLKKFFFFFLALLAPIFDALSFFIFTRRSRKCTCFSSHILAKANEGLEQALRLSVLQTTFRTVASLVLAAALPKSSQFSIAT